MEQAPTDNCHFNLFTLIVMRRQGPPFAGCFRGRGAACCDINLFFRYGEHTAEKVALDTRPGLTPGGRLLARPLFSVTAPENSRRYLLKATKHGENPQTTPALHPRKFGPPSI